MNFVKKARKNFIILLPCFLLLTGCTNDPKVIDGKAVTKFFEKHKVGRDNDYALHKTGFADEHVITIHGFYTHDEEVCDDLASYMTKNTDEYGTRSTWYCRRLN